MSRKFALIIGNTEYTDPGLAQLTAPGKDAEDFARVLQSKDICDFDAVHISLNEPSSSVIEAVDEFFDQKKPDDLLVLYFSGHGVKDEIGSLYLAFKNTVRSRLRSTAIKSDYIREAMDQSRSKRQVLILDCCNSGAFPQGTKAELGGVMGMAKAFQGYGRFVLTASDATQFAWEGDKIIGETDNSLFTHFLMKGLEGEADSDGDGKITVDELYDYAYHQISRVTPNQTPTKSSSKQEGEIILRENMRVEDIKPIALSEDLINEIEDTRPYVREVVVQKLEKILKGKNIGLARSAKDALEKIVADENSTRRVVQSATQVLATFHQVMQADEEPKEILKAENERLASQKAEAERKAVEHAAEIKANENRLALQRIEAIRTAREREQLERQSQVIQPPQATEKKISNQRTQNRSSPKMISIIAGIVLILLLCIGGAWTAKGFIFPTLTALQTIPTTEIPNVVITSTITIPPIWTTTPIVTIQPTLTSTLIPTSTFLPSLTIPPSDPLEFLIYYFDTVIFNKDLTKGWSLLTPTYQTEIAKGWESYTKFWTTVENWTYSTPKTEYNNISRARILITYTLFYNNNSNPSLLDGVRYCLLWDDSIRTWKIDLRNNCP